MVNSLSRDVYRRLYSSTSRTFPLTSFTTTVVLAPAYTVVGVLPVSTTTLAGVPVVALFSTFFLGTK